MDDIKEYSSTGNDLAISANVYSTEIIEFVTIAVQTCLLLEHISEQSKRQFAEKMLIYLPVLYQRAMQLHLSGAYTESEGFVQHIVAEDDYNMIAGGIKQMLGTDDAYLEVFVDDMRYSDEPITAFLSENIADIYQEIKDMAYNYGQQIEPLMVDAISECISSFGLHWGQKTLNAMRALHVLVMSDDWGKDDED